MQKHIPSFDRFEPILAGCGIPCAWIRPMGSHAVVALNIHPGDINYFAIRAVGRCDTSAASILASPQHPPPQGSALCVQLPADTKGALLAEKRATSLGL